MKSLLNRSLTRFIVCTAVILLICTPLFYLLTRYFYAEDLIDLIESIHQNGTIPANDLEQDIMAGVMLQFALIVAVLGIALVVTLHWVSKRLWIPFEDTLHKTEAFHVEESQLPEFMPTDIQEFDALNASLTQLMRRSCDRYRQQKEFTENASHELQTPIAVMQSKLDILLQEDLNQRQTQIVQEFYHVCSRMARLNRNLLLLAKIDNSQYELREQVDMTALTTSNSAQLQELYSLSKPVHIVAGTCIVSANRSLSEIMINNLLINAFRHTPTDGTIEVAYNSHRLTVRNSAEGGALNGEHIFDRFNHSADPNRGVGIGLAIVKAICDYHGWTIEYAFAKHNHEFTIYFK